jgi:hypothetical protein
MATLPSAQDSARYILSIFVEDFHKRPGEVLRLNSLMMRFQGVWRMSELEDGIAEGVRLGWIEQLRDGAVRLLKPGFDEA